MNSRTCVLLLLLLALGCSEAPDVDPAADPALTPAPTTWDITVDGEPADFEDEPAPAEGQVTQLGGYRIALGPPGEYRFRTEGEELHLLQESGDWRRVGVAVQLVKQGDDYVVDNPLAEMSLGEVRHLLSLDVHKPFDGLAAKLAAVDPERCVVRLWLSELDDWKRFPDLPAGLRYLSIWLSHEEGDEYGNPLPDLSALGRLTALRWLEVYADQTRFDLGLVAGARELAHLDVQSGQLIRPGTLARFERLRFLDITQSRIRDLTPLSGHQRLEAIHADYSRVERLPGGQLPALRELLVTGAEVSPEERRRFRKANPHCQVSRTWKEMFDAAVAGADRLLLIDGTEKPDEKDPLLFEWRDSEAVPEFLRALEFDDPRCGTSCFCGPGYPAVEIRAGEELRLRIGIKHSGHVLAIPALEQGDASVTKASAEALVAWVRTNGGEKFRDVFQEATDARAPLMRRYARYQELLPPRVIRSIEDDWDAEVLRTFAGLVPDAVERGRLYLRLLGVGDAPWNETHGFEGTNLDHWLPSLEAETLWTAVAAGRDDAETKRGAARWFLGERVGAGSNSEALLRLARYALASPRRFNRQRTMVTLAEIGGPAARELLALVVAEKVKPRGLPEGASKPDEYSVYRLRDQKEKDVSDAEFAKSLLEGAADGGR